MKKFLILTLTILFLVFGNTLVFARAGGGSSGSSGSSGGTSSTGSGYYSHGNGYYYNPFVTIFECIAFGALSCSTIIIIKVRLTKAKVKTKKKFKETTWNYKVTQKQVEEAYFNIQEAWKNGDMSTCKNYMTKELLENFQMKLDWMEIASKKNVLENISLLEAYPVSLTDCDDDSLDRVWVYIKGKMVDYIINTKTDEVIEGTKKINHLLNTGFFVKMIKIGGYFLKFYRKMR